MPKSQSPQLLPSQKASFGRGAVLRCQASPGKEGSAGDGERKEEGSEEPKQLSGFSPLTCKHLPKSMQPLQPPYARSGLDSITMFCSMFFFLYPAGRMVEKGASLLRSNWFLSFRSSVVYVFRAHGRGQHAPSAFLRLSAALPLGGFWFQLGTTKQCLQLPQPLVSGNPSEIAMTKWERGGAERQGEGKST